MTDIPGLIVALIIVLAIGMAFGLLLAFPVMWIWNSVVVSVCGFNTITWGQAWLLMLLMRLLCPSSSSSSSN